MNELLSEYDEAIRTKGSEIRSHEGETINRYDSALECPSELSKTALLTVCSLLYFIY